MTSTVGALVWVTLAAGLVCACGGSKAPAPEGKAVRPQSAMMPDSMPKTMPAARAKPAGPLRDSAFGPRFTVDSAGKVVPIKRP